MRCEALAASKLPTSMPDGRIHNFSAGPGTLPTEVLNMAQEGLCNFRGAGMGVMEMSHRSPEFESILNGAENLLRELLGIPDDYRVLFLQGGASMQFAQIPIAFGAPKYVVIGAWGEKAAAEAGMEPIWTDKDQGYRHVPMWEDLDLGNGVVHITTNETIHGVEFASDPPEGAEIIADASSNIVSRPMDVSRYAMIYAGAQKNLGPAGVTIAIMRDSLLSRHRDCAPTMLDYRVHAKNGSLYNTPPCWPIFMVGLVLQWVKANGGATGMAKRNEEKSATVYGALDGSEGFYRPHALDRSRMNVVFTLRDEKLTTAFVNEANSLGLNGLAGHRAVGGIRASLYNAMPIEGARALAEFMSDFARRHG